MSGQITPIGSRQPNGLADEREALRRAERLAGQMLARAGVAALHQIKQLQRLNRVIHLLSQVGFVPLSFAALALEAPTITIEQPADALLDALEHQHSICGRYRREGATLWLSIDGVRVQWREEGRDGSDDPRRAA